MGCNPASRCNAAREETPGGSKRFAVATAAEAEQQVAREEFQLPSECFHEFQQSCGNRLCDRRFL